MLGARAPRPQSGDKERAGETPALPGNLGHHLPVTGIAIEPKFRLSLKKGYIVAVFRPAQNWLPNLNV